MESVYITTSPEKTIALGKKVATYLHGGDNVLLFGDLGAGKTHFTKGIAKGLGIKEVIKSPTYVYVNRYSIGKFQTPNPKRTNKLQILNVQTNSKSQFYHYDLYRLSAGDDVSSIGLEETMQDQSAINVVEWADRMGEELPDRYISVNFKQDGDDRKITIKFVSPQVVPADQITGLYAEWMTPMHIRDHCKMVTKVAMQLAEAYVRKGEIINLELLYSAGMLHDLHRVCDFRELDRGKFNEEVTDEKWAKWIECRNTYKNQHHADITAEILFVKGFTDTAEVIRLHMSKNLIVEPQSYDTIEKKIMYYADKRVKHDQIVDLEERFRDGYERHGKFDPPEVHQIFEKVKKATFVLEKELFEGLDIRPEDIN